MWYNDLRPEAELIPNKYALIFYQDHLKMSEADKKRALQHLVELKQGLVAKIPPKTMDRNILLASWNIKEFGHLGNRLPESYYYIAEIINAFDIVAIQEVKRTLFDLNLVMRLLGSHWAYVITDVTEGTPGNKERFGYIYDTRRVQHSGLSGELVIPEDMANEETKVFQLKRTPSIAGFKSGWKSFAIIGLHLHPGNEDDDQELRKEEVRLLLEVLKEKKDNGHLWSENLIVLGDTNLYNDNTDIVQLFTDDDFKESAGLLGKPTNASLSESYDRIFMGVDRYFKLVKDANDIEKGGVFNLYDYVFSNAQRPLYHDFMLAHKDNPATLTDDDAFDSYYHRYWKRNQISDHLPIWIEIEEDSSSDFLESKRSQIDD
ncbi:MAG: endonuclease/exonuclease/phosphatase family protein [Flavobacteriaceae bacterium]